MSKDLGLGQLVKKHRDELGWSQHQLARRAKLSQSLVSKAESAGTPQESGTTPLTVAKIARAFGLLPSDLVQDPDFWKDSPELQKNHHHLAKALGDALKADDRDSVHHLAQFVGHGFNPTEHSALDVRILLEMIERQPAEVWKLWEDEPLGFRAGKLLLDGLTLLRKNALLPTPEALAIVCAIIGARKNATETG